METTDSQLTFPFLDSLFTDPPHCYDRFHDLMQRTMRKFRIEKTLLEKREKHMAGRANSTLSNLSGNVLSFIILLKIVVSET